MRFLHRVAVQDQPIVNDGIFSFDLAVNPLSVALIALRPLNDTGTLAAFQSYKGICSALNRVSVLFNGVAVQSMRGEDLAAMNYFRRGIMPFQGQHDDTNDERRCVVLPMIFGKFPFDPGSCFPATRRGELSLELDVDVADTGYDGLRLSVETVELLDARPKEYERCVSINQSTAATGDNEVDLPVGNMVRGMLLFGTTPFSGATPVPSFGRLNTHLDNEQIGYASTDWEVLQMTHCLWGRQPPAYDGHMHRITTSGCPQTALATIEGPFNVGAGIAGATDITGWHQYAFMDYDLDREDTFSLDTSGKARFRLSYDAEAADLVRVVPVERIKV